MSDKYQSLVKKDQKIMSNISYENPLFRFLPDSFFKVRNTIFYPFHIIIPYINYSIGFILALIGVFGLVGVFTYNGFKLEGWDGYVLHGKYASIILGLVFLFQTKSSLLRLLTGMSLETQIRIHKVFALSLLILVFGHAIRILNSTQWKFNSQKRVSGAFMISCVIILAIQGVISRIVKINFNSFIIIHKICFITIYVAAFIHGAYFAFYFGIFWIWLDLIVLRGISILINRNALQDINIEPIGDQYVKMTFKKKQYFKFQEGQYMYFIVPQYQQFNFHPFSICTSNYDDEFYFIAKRFDRLTDYMFKQGLKNQKPFLLMDGPYGGPIVNPENYDFFVFIGGGAGITPLLSISKKLLHENNLGKPIKQIIFIWSSKNTLLLPELKKLQQINKEILQIKIFITKEDILDESQDNIQKGRPDLKEELIQVQEQAISQNCQEVGLYVCGPMIHEVVRIKDDKVFNKVKFRTHYEEFSTLVI